VHNAEIRVLIASGERLLSEVLGAALAASGFSLVSGAHDAMSAVDRIAAENPDVAVITAELVRLGSGGAIERLLRGRTTRLLLVPSSGRLIDVQFARQIGASGFVPETSSLEQLVAAIRAIAAGDTYFPPEVSGSDAGQTAERARSARPHNLTNRELQVLLLIADGMSSRQIASTCQISVRTVESHRVNLMRKLDVRKLSDLVRIAIREGIIED
jgi:DNA-binding NarL/FixJ family response regulator